MATAATAGLAAPKSLTPAQMQGEADRLNRCGATKNEFLADLNRVLAHCEGDSEWTRICEAGDVLEVSSSLIHSVINGKSPIGEKLIYSLYGAFGSSIAADWLEEPADPGPCPLDAWRSWPAAEPEQQPQDTAAPPTCPRETSADGEAAGSLVAPPPPTTAAAPVAATTTGEGPEMGAAIAPPPERPPEPAPPPEPATVGLDRANDPESDPLYRMTAREVRARAAAAEPGPSDTSLLFAVTAIDAAIIQIEADTEFRVAQLRSARAILERLAA